MKTTINNEFENFISDITICKNIILILIFHWILIKKLLSNEGKINETKNEIKLNAKNVEKKCF